jgi:hypothetical protein
MFYSNTFRFLSLLIKGLFEVDVLCCVVFTNSSKTTGKHLKVHFNLTE